MATSSNPPQMQLSSEGRKVLIVLSQQAMDGYTLMSRSGLEREEAERALEQLMAAGLVDAKGEPFGENLGRAYLWVPANAQGRANFLLGKLAI